jgi:serine/threonine-protein kinase
VGTSIDDLMGMLLGGRYRVVRLIGRGGMGAVHIARDEQLGSDVAVKVVREALLDDPAALARFKREAKLLPGLVHEHIVRAFSAGEDDGLLWIAMELLEGETLRARIDQRGRMAWRDSVVLIRQIASALGAAHEKGVVHRDLKPENIMVLTAATPGGIGDVRLLDFGVAKGMVREGSGAASMTGTGMMIGTPGYIAPEVILDGRADDPRSDLYALGVVWFEMLTGARPFTAKTPVALAMAHAHQPAPTPSSLLPFSPLPQPIERVVMSLLAKVPEERPASAAALMETLSTIEQAAIDDEKNPRRTPQELPPSMPTITDVRPTPSYAMKTDTAPPTQTAGPPAHMTPAGTPATAAAMGSTPHTGTPHTGMLVGTPQGTPLPPFLANLTGTRLLAYATGFIVAVAVVIVVVVRAASPAQPPALPTAAVVTSPVAAPVVAPPAPPPPPAAAVPVVHVVEPTPPAPPVDDEPVQKRRGTRRVERVVEDVKPVVVPHNKDVNFVLVPKDLGGDVWVDGKKVGEVPVKGHMMMTGVHVVEFKTQEQTFTKRVVIDDSTATVRLELTKNADGAWETKWRP